MATNIESLNDHEDKVFMIHALYKEVKDLTYKRQCLRSEYYFMDTIHSTEVEDMVSQLSTIEIGIYNESSTLL